MPTATAFEEQTERQPFGAWLVRQTGAREFVAELANSAAKDRSFPRQGTVDDARKWLQQNLVGPTYARAGMWDVDEPHPHLDLRRR